MGDPKEHRLRRIEERAGLADGPGDGTADVTVEWADAAPDERPTGMVWEPSEGRLRYDFWSAQRDCLEWLESDAADLVAFLGGYRSGKSVTGARWVLTKALEYPGTRWLAMGIDFSRATSTTYRVLYEQLPGDRTGIVTSSYSGPESSPVVADHHRGQHRLTLANDSVIILGSADTWSRYAGDEFSGVWLDEPSHYDDLHSILEMVGSRLTADRGPKTQFWTLTGNGYNSAYEILERREDEDGDAIGLDIELVRASVFDNPYVDEADKKRLRRQFAETGREDQALHGGFAATTGLVYSEFSRDRHVIPHREAVERVGERRLYGYDAGWRDPRVCLELGRTDYGQLVVLDEFYREESHVDDVVEWVGYRPPGTVFAEHVPAEIDKMQRAGIGAQKADKNIDAGISAVRHRFECDDEDRPGLLISDRCEHLIRELQGYKREHVGTAAAEDHCADALRYAVMGDENGAEPSVGVAFG